MLKIKWTKRALTDLDQTLTYLETEWGIRTAMKLNEKLLETLKMLALHREIGNPIIERPGYRKMNVKKYSSLYYRYTATQIEILSFFSNRQNPDKMSFNEK